MQQENWLGGEALREERRDADSLPVVFLNQLYDRHLLTRPSQRAIFI